MLLCAEGTVGAAGAQGTAGGSEHCCTQVLHRLGAARVRCWTQGNRQRAVLRVGRDQ